MTGYQKDIIRKFAMQILTNLEFRAMSAVPREDQLKIKEVLFMIYVDEASSHAERAVREKALESFRAAHGIKR